jgi:hypothetical protein
MVKWSKNCMGRISIFNTSVDFRAFKLQPAVTLQV